jgi:hypothetical protein
MSYPSLAVIGTAGRKEDKQYLTLKHYNRMVQATMRLLDHLNVDLGELKLYSGGAAWADHVVVTLILLRYVKAENVTLFLPTEVGENGFFGQDDKSSKTASTCNYYHQYFSDQLSANTVDQILEVGSMGALLDPGTGNFFQRNSSVAKAVSPDGLLLAFTFGNPNSDQREWSLRPSQGSVKAEAGGLKDGGTADTWNKASCLKWHGKIGKTP